MKKPWSESRLIFPLMYIVVGILLLFAPLKAGFITFNDIESKKDLIDTLSKILGSIILLLGAVFSYIRFFKGRILKPKINLQLKNGYHLVDDKHLHWLEIAIENKGSVTLWNYTVGIYLRAHPGAEHPIDISDCLIMPTNTEEHEHLVDVGETEFEHGIIELDKEPHAYTFEVVICDDRGTRWRRCLTANNVEQKHKADPKPFGSLL